MNEKIKVLFVIIILAGVVIFTGSFIYFTQKSKDEAYESTRAILTYDKISNKTFLNASDLLKDISKKFSVYNTSNYFSFSFYHRDASDKINYDYEISGTLFHQDTQNMVIDIHLKGKNNPGQDKEMLRNDVEYLSSLLEPLVNKPKNVEYQTLYSGAHSYRISNLFCLYLAIIIVIIIISIIGYICFKLKRKGRDSIPSKRER